MSTIKVRTLDGQAVDFTLPPGQEGMMDSKKELLLIPGIIDSHLSFSSSDTTSILQAVRGGITTAIITPTKDAPCNTAEDIDKVTKMAGMDITFVTTAKTDAEAYALLEELGMPFKK